jgi:hypothetical protein
MRLGKEPEFKATIIECDRHEARANWDEAQRFLEESVERGIGDLTTKDLQTLCFNGAAALLTFVDPKGDMVGSAVTQLLRHSDGRMVLSIVAYGADDFEATCHCLAQVEADAKKRGAQAVQFYGRKGWVRVCIPMGYDCKHVIMEKVL